MSHAPASVSDVQKRELLASSFSGESLFDESALDRVLGQVREDTALSAQLAISQAAPFSFSAGKASRKASAEQPSDAPAPGPSSAASSSPQASIPTFSFGRKRRGSQASSRGRGRGKAPKLQNPTPKSGGRGFGK